MKLLKFGSYVRYIIETCKYKVEQEKVTLWGKKWSVELTAMFISEIKNSNIIVKLLGWNSEAKKNENKKNTELGHLMVTLAIIVLPLVSVSLNAGSL